MRRRRKGPRRSWSSAAKEASGASRLGTRAHTPLSENWSSLLDQAREGTVHPQELPGMNAGGRGMAAAFERCGERAVLLVDGDVDATEARDVAPTHVELAVVVGGELVGDGRVVGEDDAIVGHSSSSS